MKVENIAEYLQERMNIHVANIQDKIQAVENMKVAIIAERGKVEEIKYLLSELHAAESEKPNEG